MRSLTLSIPREKAKSMRKQSSRVSLLAVSSSSRTSPTGQPFKYPGGMPPATAYILAQLSCSAPVAVFGSREKKNAIIELSPRLRQEDEETPERKEALLDVEQNVR